MTQETKRAVVDRYIEAYNSYDIEALIEVLDPEVEFKHMTGNKVEASTNGINAFMEMTEQMKEVFASREQTITAFNETEDKVNLEFDYKVEFGIDFPNGLKKGERLELQGKSEIFFKGDKIIKIYDQS